MRNQETLGFHGAFGLNINLLQWVTRINIVINHVWAHYYSENRPFKLHLHQHFDSNPPSSAHRF